MERMEMNLDTDITVIGGGFTGAALVLHLARAVPGPLRVSVIEPSGRIGYGLAYGTGNPLHRVNVPAERMNVFGDMPGDFLRWALEEKNLLSEDPHARGSNGGIYPRRLDFGNYMADRLSALAGPRLALEIIKGRATEIVPNGQGVRVRIDDGTGIHSGRVVLCNSHARPHFPWALDAVTRDLPGRIDDPWAEGVLGAVPGIGDVLIVGTGLTMADTVLQLLDQGHSGHIVAVSRRGLLPQGNCAYGEVPEFIGDARLPSGPRALLRLLRIRLKEAERVGITWQMVIEGLRKSLPDIWDHWPDSARRSALRHLGPYWNTRRFRLAPQVEQALTSARARGRLQVVAGQVAHIGHEDGRRFRVGIRPRGSRRVNETCFDTLINCIGPDGHLARSRDPLMQALIRSGLVTPDPLGLGLHVDAQCRVIDAEGRPHPGIYAAGPLTRPRFAEMMAVRDIATQTTTLARHLVSDIDGGSAHAVSGTRTASIPDPAME
jgi:uncharacterized NAD(P)/FAD-binding protein YdhS